MITTLQDSQDHNSSKIENIGIVISLTDGTSPNVLSYHFILNDIDVQKVTFIRQGQYCVTSSAEGLVIE